MFFTKNTYLKLILLEPLGYFGHSQNCNTPNDVIDLIKFNIELEKKCDPGTDRDLIMVNNVNYEIGNKFLDKIYDTQIGNGQIKCVTRKYRKEFWCI